MKLRDFIKLIRREKAWTQEQMAAAMGVSQQNIQKLENPGSTLEKQWKLFTKLLAVSRELDSDPARALYCGHIAQLEKDLERYVEQQANQATGRSHKRSTKGFGKKGDSFISPGGSSGAKPRKRRA